jgi:PAS domain S-box-containing protein
MVTLSEILRWIVYTVKGLYRRLAAWALRRDKLLLRSERRFSALLESAPDAMVIVDWHGHIRLVNAQTEQLFGYERKEIIGQNVTELVPKRFRSQHREHQKAYVKDAKPRLMGSNLDLYGRRKDGSEFPIEISLSPLETEGGLLVSSAIRDVSDRKRTEAELKARADLIAAEREALAEAQAVGQMGSWRQELASGETSTSKEFRRIFAGAQLTRTGGFSLAGIEPEDLDGVLEAMVAARRGEDAGSTYRWRRPGGELVHLHLRVRGECDDTGTVVAIAGTVQDITERKRVERHLDALVHGATLVLAQSGTIEEALPALLRSVGEGMGWPVGIYWGPGAASNLVCEAYWDGRESPSHEFEVVTRDASPKFGEGPIGRAWANREPVWVADITGEEGFVRSESVLESGLRGAILLPILSGGERLGLIEFLSEEIRPPDPALVELFRAFSAQVGHFVARKQAEAEADRLKAEFFALVSHELRTPLTSIMGYLDLVEEEEAEEMGDTGRRFLGVISRNASRLDHLVEDLLLVTQVEAGTFTVDLASVDLVALARDSVEAAMPRAEERHLELTISADSLPDCAGDAQRLAQVLDNLISNAVKFTLPDGNIDVRVRRSGDRAVIEVEDTGPGIPATELEHLFDRFFRAAGARENEIQGVGVGLAIAQAIAEAHGGQIEAESTVGKGSTFRVALPLRPPPDVGSSGGVAVRRGSAWARSSGQAAGAGR